jgi:hypothetical protein
LIDTFTFACDGWLDSEDNLPLKYEFKYIIPAIDENEEISLTSASLSPSKEVNLKSSPDNLVTAVAHIIDNLGAVTRKEFSTYVSSIDFSDHSEDEKAKSCKPPWRSRRSCSSQPRTAQLFRVW